MSSSDEGGPSAQAHHEATKPPPSSGGGAPAAASAGSDGGDDGDASAHPIGRAGRPRLKHAAGLVANVVKLFETGARSSVGSTSADAEDLERVRSLGAVNRGVRAIARRTSVVPAAAAVGARRKSWRRPSQGGAAGIAEESAAGGAADAKGRAPTSAAAPTQHAEDAEGAGTAATGEDPAAAGVRDGSGEKGPMNEEAGSETGGEPAGVEARSGAVTPPQPSAAAVGEEVERSSASDDEARPASDGGRDPPTDGSRSPPPSAASGSDEAPAGGVEGGTEPLTAPESSEDKLKTADVVSEDAILVDVDDDHAEAVDYSSTSSSESTDDEAAAAGDAADAEAGAQPRIGAAVEGAGAPLTPRRKSFVLAGGRRPSLGISAASASQLARRLSAVPLAGSQRSLISVAETPGDEAPSIAEEATEPTESTEHATSEPGAPADVAGATDRPASPFQVETSPKRARSSSSGRSSGVAALSFRVDVEESDAAIDSPISVHMADDGIGAGLSTLHLATVTTANTAHVADGTALAAPTTPPREEDTAAPVDAGTAAESSSAPATDDAAALAPASPPAAVEPPDGAVNDGSDGSDDGDEGSDGDGSGTMDSFDMDGLSGLHSFTERGDDSGRGRLSVDGERRRRNSRLHEARRYSAASDSHDVLNNVFSRGSSSVKREIDDAVEFRNALPTMVYDVVKINQRGRKQRRHLQFTTDAILNTRPKGNKTTRTHSYLDVVHVSLMSHDQFVIAFKHDHDYVYVTPIAAQIVQELNTRVALERAVDKKKLTFQLAVSFQQRLAQVPSRGGGARAVSVRPRVEKKVSRKASKLMALTGETEGQRTAIAIQRLLFDSSTPEGRTRAHFVKTDFPRLMKDKSTAPAAVRNFIDGMHEYIMEHQRELLERMRIDMELESEDGSTVTDPAAAAESVSQKVMEEVENAVYASVRTGVMKCIKAEVDLLEEKALVDKMIYLRAKPQSFFHIPPEHQSGDDWSAAVLELQEIGACRRASRPLLHDAHPAAPH